MNFSFFLTSANRLKTKPSFSSHIAKICRAKSDKALSIVLCILLLSEQVLTSMPGQGCKLVRKFVDATGEVDMRNVLMDAAVDDLLRSNPSIICIAWRIVGYDKESVRIMFREFNVSSRLAGSTQPPIPAYEQQTCLANSIYVKDTDSALAKERPAVSTISGPYCGFFSDPLFWWSNGNDVIIEYHIRSLEQAKRDRFRFQFSVLTPMHGCGFEAIVYSPSMSINASSGEISSPFDRTVASHSRCYWSIVAPEDSAFHIEFTKYSIDPSAAFVLTINDVFDPIVGEGGNTIIGPRCCEVGPTAYTNGNGLKTIEMYDDMQCLCLKGNPPPVQSSSNVIHVYYESRSVLSNVNQGFTLKWRHVKRALQPSSTTTAPPPTTTTPLLMQSPDTTSEYEYTYDDPKLGFGSYTTPRDSSDYSTDGVSDEPDSADSKPVATNNGNSSRSVDDDNQPSDVDNFEITTTTLADSSIPIIYLDEDQVSNNDMGEEDLAEARGRTRQRLKSTTTDLPTTNEVATGSISMAYVEDETEYPTQVSTGPISMFAASSRQKNKAQQQNCCSMTRVPLLAPVQFIFGITLLRAFECF